MSERGALRPHVPEPTGRPWHPTDFSYLHVSPAGVVRAGRGSTDEGRAVGHFDEIARVRPSSTRT